MLRATGPGKAEVRSSPPSLMLYNFDIDGDVLKREHIDFLRLQALPALRAGGSVRVIGLTDRSASDAHNKVLSDKRVARTIEFLRRELPPGGLNLNQASGFGEGAAAAEGEADGSHDERFRTVLLFLAAAPVVTKKSTIEIAAKSFIAVIGGATGTMPGWTTTPPVPPLPPIPVTRQTLLEILAKATDAQFSENPMTVAKDKHYRLFSSCKFEIVFEDGKVLACVPSTLDTDVGMEGPLQPPPLVTTPVFVGPTGFGFVMFSWSGRARPHLLAEPGFQLVQPRTSFFIWHTVAGRIDVSKGAPVASVTLTGSKFPTHRAFVNGTPQLPGLPQGPFTNLWVADSADPSKVA